MDFTEHVAESTVRAAAEEAVRAVDAGSTDPLALGVGQSLVGTVFVTPGCRRSPRTGAWSAS